VITTDRNWWGRCGHGRSTGIGAAIGTGVSAMGASVGSGGDVGGRVGVRPDGCESFGMGRALFEVAR
jgi:hypothetical protein